MRKHVVWAIWPGFGRRIVRIFKFIVLLDFDRSLLGRFRLINCTSCARSLQRSKTAVGGPLSFDVGKGKHVQMLVLNFPISFINVKSATLMRISLTYYFTYMRGSIRIYDGQIYAK